MSWLEKKIDCRICFEKKRKLGPTFFNFHDFSLETKNAAEREKKFLFNFVSFAFLPIFSVLKNKHKRNNFQTNEGEVNHFMDFKKVDDVCLGRKKFKSLLLC